MNINTAFINLSNFIMSNINTQLTTNGLTNFAEMDNKFFDVQSSMNKVCLSIYTYAGKFNNEMRDVRTDLGIALYMRVQDKPLAYVDTFRSFIGYNADLGSTCIVALIDDFDIFSDPTNDYNFVVVIKFTATI